MLINILRKNNIVKGDMACMSIVSIKIKIKISIAILMTCPEIGSLDGMWWIFNLP